MKVEKCESEEVGRWKGTPQAKICSMCKILNPKNLINILIILIWFSSL